MFTKVISLLTLVAPLASALTLTVPPGVTSGGNIIVNWTTVAGDPSSWSFELIDPSAGFSPFAFANNVDPSLPGISLECPIVPSDSNYAIQAVNISDINQVYATSPLFFIGPTISSSGSPSSSISATGTSANTNTQTSTTTSLPSVTTSASTSSTGTGTSTGTTSTGTTGTDTGTTASTTPSTAAAASLRLTSTNAGYAVLLLSAVTGAAALAL